ncbi:hypothetical protein Halru_0662 [Halovivax ruber XH-70]|uniref:Uncharacterized protein n=1 Tax=Halovivax ruber (strain DSM 18193 / JCM 13892 / XH-70) TaxID=797302 RepID=L0I9C1_HALRX|nr:hypothetical protein [Halovivax ruber]AGB15289.1 hypothetical protein Halru_0662 [Halovivax ruber XH-70]
MSDDEGYVHDPATFDEAGERTDDESDSTLTGVHPTSVDRTFGWRGWVLVGIIVLAFIVAPAGIYLLPPGAEGYRFALILFPLFPALLLAAGAVWATTRP